MVIKMAKNIDFDALMHDRDNIANDWKNVFFGEPIDIKIDERRQRLNNAYRNFLAFGKKQNYTR